MAQPEISNQVLEPRRAAAPRRGRRVLRRLVRGLAALLLLAVITLIAAGLWARSRVAASLPPLTGEASAPGLTRPVTIARDKLGIPAIQAADRRDAAFATGFVHAQDRFFQMDLIRRQAAGEMAEVLGARGLRIDRVQRIHRFRALAQRLLEQAPAEQRALVEAYTRGVNAGLATLREKPFEYLVLQSAPQAWKPEDTYLILCAMFLMLQDRTGSFDSLLGLMQDTLPPELFAFLTPWGDEWDAPLLGEPLAAPTVPGPQVFDARKAPRQAPRAASFDRRDRFIPAPREMAASNAWAVAGSRTADGRALLASDMHTGLNVPPLWYRLSLSWSTAAGARRRVTGVSVPGTPIVVAGSNGRVAWGFTNSRIDTTDVVLVEPAPGRDLYRTPRGPVRFRHHREVLRANGGQEEVLDVIWTIWGPMIEDDHWGRHRALRWVAHQPEALNLNLLELESAGSTAEALDVAQRSGIPAQSFLAVDDGGRIGWTLAGRVPRREGFDGRTPVSWADGRRRWNGWLGPGEIPRIDDPAPGRLWSANNRMVSGEPLARLGDGNYVLGARARQIRDRLMEIDRATPRDMLTLQLDDRALFLARWQRLLLEVLTPEAIAADPRRREVRKLVENWGGRAALDSVGYRLVREFRDRLALQIFAAPTRACLEADPDFDYTGQIDRLEAPLWRLVSERPPHFLDPRYESWNEQFLAVVDSVMVAAAEEGSPLAEWTWGRRNRAAIHHLLGGAIPFAGRWLNMPPDPLPGDDDMPRVQRPDYGASFRMVVSPGREEEGFSHMPAGQSGHPMSPHYSDGEAAWVQGNATPFLPGPPVNTFILKPAH